MGKIMAGIALVLGLMVGYFAGREHLKYEMRSAFSLAANELNSEFSEILRVESSPSARVDGAKAEEISEKQTYAKNHLVLYDVTATYYDSVIDGKVPGVEFKVKNNGGRALSRVDVTVYFKDAFGAVIFEKTYSPVSDRSILENNDPLKPGYIWQLERGKFYPAKDVPTEWDEGSAEASITRIEFAATQKD